MASLENYTFLTQAFSMQATNVYADSKRQLLKGFSNILEFPPSDPTVRLPQHVTFPTPVEGRSCARSEGLEGRDNGTILDRLLCFLWLSITI
jgi:hypothetical protein